MRRAPIVLTATVVTTIAVLSFRPREAAVDASAVADSAAVATTGDTTVATGGPVTSQFGVTQVKATIQGGKIVDVEAIKINSNEQRSVEISQAAVPTLRQEVLDKQSAAVDMVSGATVTSQAYAASLQSALDKAGFTAPDGSTASTAAPAEVDEHGGRGDRLHD